jgi:hypothetical protein
MRGVTVKHALTSTSSPPNDIPSIPWSPVVLPLWTPRLGGLARAVSNGLVYLGCRTLGSCFLGNCSTWALVPSSQSTLVPAHRIQLREEGWSKLNVGAILVTCHTAHVAIVWCKAGNQVPVSYRETRRPHSRRTKVQTGVLILTRNQARRHRVYSGNYPEHLLLQERTKRRNQASVRDLPIPLLAISASTTSAYSSLGVSRESNP